MRKMKFDLEEGIKIVMKWWIQEKKGLGLKKSAFRNCNLKDSRINLVLRELRKRKQIVWSRRYWFIPSEHYVRLKQEYPAEWMFEGAKNNEE